MTLQDWWRENKGNDLTCALTHWELCQLVWEAASWQQLLSDQLIAERMPGLARTGHEISVEMLKQAIGGQCGPTKS